MDSKGLEVAFLKGCLEQQGQAVVVVDVGLSEPEGVLPDISRAEVAAAVGEEIVTLRRRRRDEVISAMGRGGAEVLRRLFERGELSGVLGLGGNQGTAIVCAAIRDLPLGLPKFVVSTVASGNMRPYIGASDIAVMFSVADLVGGANPVVEPVLRNAAAAIAAMSTRPAVSSASDKPLVAVTALGNTNAAVVRSVELLREAGMQVAVFHASGACGSAMERLIRTGRIAAVLELTPHELTEEVLATGVYQPVEAGRLTAAAEMGVPMVVAPGGLEYLCFGPLESIPPRLRRRRIYFHNISNANVGTTRQEMAKVGQALAERLNVARGAVAFVLPQKGWSIYGSAGGPLYDPELNAAFERALTRNLRPEIPVHKLPLEINDPEFAQYCCRLLLDFMKKEPASECATPPAIEVGAASRPEV